MGNRIGLGTSWVRQIESGYPRVRLDDHVLCYEFLSISPLAVFLPVLFHIHGVECPPHLLLGNLKHLEEAILECVVNWNLTNLSGLLRHTRADHPAETEQAEMAPAASGSDRPPE